MDKVIKTPQKEMVREHIRLVKELMAAAKAGKNLGREGKEQAKELRAYKKGRNEESGADKD